MKTIKTQIEMKKAIITFALILLVGNAMAQIEMFDESIQKKDEVKALPYDSLRNISTQKYGSGDNTKYTLHHLIGQTLLYCGDPYSYYSKHSFEKGAYYRVDGILPDDRGQGLYHRLSLTNLSSGVQTEEGDVFTDKYNYKWVVVGYYEKMKSLYLNKEFVYVGIHSPMLFDHEGMKDVTYVNPWNKGDGLINLDTDTITNGVVLGSVWTCVGVQVKPRKENDRMQGDYRSPVVLIVDNPVYGKHYCYLENKKGEPYESLFTETMPLICDRFQFKSYYDTVKANFTANKEKRKTELTNKYGAINANLIFEGKVKLGMTKAMCEESWGHPHHINKTIGSGGIHEQWVYGNCYLYFVGDKLTTIQTQE